MKKVLITGSSSGIGKAVAELFLKNAVPVVGIARQHKKFIHTSKLYTPIEADLSLIESLPELITTILNLLLLKIDRKKDLPILPNPFIATLIIII